MVTADPLTLSLRFAATWVLLYRNRYFNATEIGTKDSISTTYLDT